MEREDPGGDVKSFRMSRAVLNIDSSSVFTYDLVNCLITRFLVMGFLKYFMLL